jgi:vancomycin resistance protein YoaR
MVLAAGFISLQVVTHDRIGDGVRVAGVDVSGLTAGQAQARLTRELVPSVSPVRLITPDRTLNSSLEKLGFRVDAAASARAALAQGRHRVGGITLWLPGSEAEVPPVVHLDAVAYERTLQRVREVVDVPATDARLAMHDGDIVAVSSLDGSGVDAAALTRAIRASVAAGRPYAGPVPTKAVPPQVSTAEAQSSAAAADDYLAGPLTLRLRDLTHVLTPRRLASMLSVTTGAAAAEHPLTFDNKRARAELQALLAGAQTPAVDATITPLAGGGVSIGQSRDGTAVDMDQLVADMDETASAGAGLRTVHVALRRVSPRLSSADAQSSGLATLGSQFITYFDPRNEARATNIALAARLVDGAVVQPGAVFSLNAAIGPRTANRGFDYAPVIAADNVLRQGVGGGICQYATTLFNAAFFAGLPVVERHNHSLFIEHYPIGRDATVSWGSADFRFRNDTSRALTIRSWTDGGGALTVALVGKTGREVTTDTGDFHDVRKPKHQKADPRVIYDADLATGITRWEKGANGLSVKVTRTVRGAGGEVLFRDSYTSTYAPMDWIKRVGTG